MRKIAYGILALVALVVAAALVGPSAIDWNDYKADIARVVEARTGRTLVIGGNLDLRLLPSPRFEADDVRLASIPGATFPDLVRLESIRAKVRLMPLLSGRIEIESLALIRPVVELERLEDGRESWALGTPAAPAPEAASSGPTLPPQAPPPTAETTSGSRAANAFRLERLTVRDGTVIYRSPEGIERVEGLDGELVAASLAGPFRAEGKLRFHDVPLTFDGTLAAIKERAPTPLGLQLGLVGSDATLDVKGWIADLAAAPRLDVKVSVKGGDLADAAGRLARVAGTGGAVLPPPFARPFELAGALKADRKGAVLDELDARLGDASLAGKVELGLAGKPSLKARLKLAPLDLDNWIAAAPAGRRHAAAAPAGAGAPAAKPPFAIPADFAAAVELTSEAIKYGGRRIQDFRFAAALSDGELTLNQLSMRLPGGTEASLVGFLVAKDGRPAYEGSLDAQADDLRGFIGWLGVPVPDISPDRLRKLELTGRITGDDRQIQLADIKVRLDASRMTGGVTLALRKRPAFGARFNVDQINVDAYLPAKGPAPAASASAAPAQAPAAQPAARPAPLAVLENFDANIALRVGTLTYRRTPIQGIAFDGTLLQGALTVREAEIRSLAGASLGIAGTFRGFKAIPTFNGTFHVRSDNVGGLTRIAGISTPAPADAYGRLSLEGKADASADALSVDATLGLAGGEMKLAAKASGLAAASPQLEVDLRGSHPEVTRLARLAGVTLAEPGERLGALRFRGQIKGGMDALDVEARVVSLGGATELSGRLADPLAAAKGTGTLHIDFPELSSLLHRIDGEYRPGRARLGPAKLETRITGDAAAIRFEGLTAKLGPAALSGSASLALGGARPKLVAALEGGVIPLDAYLPRDRRRVPASPAALAAPAAAANRWDRTPIDLGPLGLADADVKLSAEAVTLDHLRIDRPVLEATLDDRVLTVSRLDGAMFGGRVAMTGKLDGRKQPALSGRLSIDKANVGKALFETAKFDILGGVLGLEADLAASGRSQRDLVRTLAGKGRFSITGGTVKGFDLAALGERLSKLDRGIDLLAVLGSATSGGTTKFDRLSGTFTAAKGVLKTDDTEIVADSGKGSLKGTADLYHWTTDMRASFDLAKPKDFPPFAMRLHGPLDQPKRTFETDRMQGFLVSRGLGSLVKRLRPAEAAPAPAAASKAPKQAKATKRAEQREALNPDDLLRGLLNGLSRGGN